MSARYDWSECIESGGLVLVLPLLAALLIPVALLAGLGWCALWVSDWFARPAPRATPAEEQSGHE